jgi:adenosylhomocysteine nucleosidase
MHNESYPTIGVVAALPAEAGVLTRVTDKMMQGCEAKGEIIIRRSGIGMQSARRQAEYLAGTSELLVSFGISGGLHPLLKTGDLILADMVMAWDPDLHKPSPMPVMPSSLRAEAGICNYIAEKFQENSIHFYRGPILCSSKPISTAASKLRAHRLTGALAADMESRAICEVAAEAGIPFFCLRAVCDPASQTVADLFPAMLDKQGNPRIGHILAHLVRRPWLLRDMIRMASQFRRALFALEAAWLLVGEQFLSSADARYVISPVRAGKR